MEAKATFGAGCFWGVEAAFRRLDGVSATAVGYAGGSVPNPTYEQVCAHATGHAEVVEVTFDPEQVPYEQLLAVFWAEHDPTQLNRQGPTSATSTARSSSSTTRSSARPPRPRATAFRSGSRGRS